MGCSDGWAERGGWTPPITPTMTPREREFDKRIAELEQVVSKIAKTIYDDDSMTTASRFVSTIPAVSTTSNTISVMPDVFQARIDALTKARDELLEIVAEKDTEIARLNDLVVIYGNELDEAYDEISSLYENLRKRDS